MHLTRGSVVVPVEDENQGKQWAVRAGERGEGGEEIDTPSVSVN